MRKIMKKSICFVLVSCMIILSGCSGEPEREQEMKPVSVAEYCFGDNYEKAEKYSVKLNEVVDAHYYEITVCEYILDRATGIGAVKCSVSAERYNSCSSGINPYFERINLLSEGREVITEKDTAYLYYKFILEKTEKDSVLYFTGTDVSIELPYTTDECKSFEDGDVKIVISPLGSRAFKDGDNNNNVISSEIYEMEKQLISNKFLKKTEKGTATVCVFKECVDVSKINIVEDVEELSPSIMH